MKPAVILMFLVLFLTTVGCDNSGGGSWTEEEALRDTCSIQDIGSGTSVITHNVRPEGSFFSGNHQFLL